MKIITLSQIKEILKSIKIIPAIEEAFFDFSQGRVMLPPIGELVFENPFVNVHIKYEYEYAIKSFDDHKLQ